MIRNALFLSAFAVLGLTSTSEAAIVTYTYTGNNFTNFIDNPSMPGAYDNSMRISGFVTLNAPLVANLVASSADADDVIPSAVDFSFSDGRQTFDSADFGTIGAAAISFSTDAFGSIVGWIVQFDRSGTASVIGDIAGGFGSDSVSFDAGTIGICASQPTCVNFPSDGFSVSAPGSWSVSNSDPSPVPLPAGLPLTLTAIAAVGALARRRTSLGQSS